MKITPQEAKERVEAWMCLHEDPDAVVSSWVRKLVASLRADFAATERDDFPYYFDEAAAYRPIDAFSLFQFAEGAWNGKDFELSDWQLFTIWMVYGWKRKANGYRRYKEVYIKIARKNGKTEFLAALGIYGQVFDDSEANTKIYWFATKKDQAHEGFSRQVEMTKLLCQKSALVAQRVRLAQYRILNRNAIGFTAFLGADSKREDGSNPFYGFCDEFHAHVTNGMRNVIRSGMVARTNPLLWTITTAGTNPEGPCGLFERVCKKILDGVSKNPALFPIIFDMDDGDDWEDERNWYKPNPNLGKSLKLENLKDEYVAAITSGVTDINNFKTKNLNMWLKAKESWIDAKVWAKNAGDKDRNELIEMLKGRLCWGGLDLASNKDLCSFVLAFPPDNDDDPWYVLHWSWAPEATIRKRVELDSKNYMDYIERGELIATEGDVTDHAAIRKHINWASDNFSLHSVAFDRALAYKLVPELVEDGLTMEPFAQSFPAMTVPTTIVETLAIEGRILHGGDSLLAWAVSNVNLVRKENLVRPVKASENEKIDPVVAMIMAVGQSNEHMTKVFGQRNSKAMVVIRI